jgi:hypothetical protein
MDKRAVDVSCAPPPVLHADWAGVSLYAWVGPDCVRVRLPFKALGRRRRDALSTEHLGVDEDIREKRFADGDGHVQRAFCLTKTKRTATEVWTKDKATGVALFCGQVTTGDTYPDRVRLNGQAFEAPIHQRVQGQGLTKEFKASQRSVPRSSAT